MFYLTYSTIPTIFSPELFPCTGANTQGSVWCAADHPETERTDKTRVLWTL